MISVQVNSKAFEKAMADVMAKGERNLQNALLKSALTIQEEAMRRTPKDTGKLRSSYYVDWQAKGIKVGNSAEYALAVHEALGTMDGMPRPAPSGAWRGHYWDYGEPKFLEKAVEASTEAIMRHFTEALNATFS